MQLIKTVIADDQRIFIEGLKTVLQQHNEFKFDILASVYSGREILRTLKKTKAELLILELNLPGIDGIDIIEQIQKERLSVRILALTSYDDPKIVKSAFKAGTNAYLLKNQKIDELFVAIREIQKGNNYFGEGVTINRPNGVHTKAFSIQQNHFFEDSFIKKHHLTKRELEILALITQALSNKEIAKILFISDQTVSVHRKNIMRKLGVSNTAGLIKAAYDHSLV
ncbi:MAG: DNA-binding response regulator [Saprospiraceae bacterium]|nr:MAG: DNA-binding response regulator [Saprospiraceae bacterium]